MPLLALEPILHPNSLFDVPPPSGGWWAFATQPRAEKSLARRLRDRDVAYFLPLARRRWKRNGRVFNSYLPLFPGYLFVFGDADARLAALQTNLVTRALPVPDQCQLHTDLARVHRLLAAGEPVAAEDNLVPGKAVIVTHGPFAGMEGTILRRDRELRFVIRVELLHRGVSLAIEDWMFQPLEPAAPTAGNGRPAFAGGIGGTV
jgi:transcription antitermination factor NusG